jgi:LytS/YehU family sensor histidine kinase
MLYAQFPGIGMFIIYEKNPFNILKYPFYPLLYGLLYLFIVVIARGQRYRLNIRREQEKELVQLQLKAIRNQIDPHFTLNVLNAIGSLYSEERNKEKADYIFGKYAKMIRQTVISSDRVIVTIEEELDFVKNYIEIENFRYNNSFSYSIDIKEDTDVKARIPRMLIHTFVENAIKYGIRNRPQGGILKIVLQKTRDIQSIIVENNGPFLAGDDPLLHGTGKGLLILNDLIGLFYKIEKIRITYDVRNIVDEDPDNQVTRAIINLPSSS